MEGNGGNWKGLGIYYQGNLGIQLNAVELILMQNIKQPTYLNLHTQAEISDMNKAVLNR